MGCCLKCYFSVTIVCDQLRDNHVVHIHICGLHRVVNLTSENAEVLGEPKNILNLSKVFINFFLKKLPVTILSE
jgi:hypothetical protein